MLNRRRMLQEDFVIKQARYVGTGNYPVRGRFKMEKNVPSPMDLSAAEQTFSSARNIVCYRCQRTGHIARDCKLPYISGNRSGRQRNRRPNDRFKVRNDRMEPKN